MAGVVAWVLVTVVTYGLLRTGTIFNEVWARGVENAPITITLAGILDIHTWFLGSTLSEGTGVLTIIPVALLLAAGYLTASGSNPTTPRAGFLAGATVALGYLALLVVSIVAFQVLGAGSGGTTGGSQLGLRLALTGIVYPVVFGGLGGLAASAR